MFLCSAFAVPLPSDTRGTSLFDGSSVDTNPDSIKKSHVPVIPIDKVAKKVKAAIIMIEP